MFPLDLAASVALPIVGSILAGKDVGSASAGNAYNEGIQYLKDVYIPSVAEQMVNWEDLVQSGSLTWQQAAEIKADPSKLRDFVGSDTYTQAAEKGLEQLQGIAEGGLTTADLAALEQIRGQITTQQRGQRERILQSAQERGVGGSGLEMTESLMNQQASADRQSLEGLLAAGRGEERRMEAAQRAANLGSQLRGQEFGEEQAKSEAERLINQFNAGLATKREEANIGRQERAQFQNMADQRRAEELNAIKRNEARTRNADLSQQRYQNELARAQAMMGGKGGVAASSEAAAERKMRLYGAGLGGAGQILGDYYADKRKQKSPGSFMKDFKDYKAGIS